MDVYKIRMGGTKARSGIPIHLDHLPSVASCPPHHGATYYFLSTEQAKKKHIVTWGHFSHFYTMDNTL